MDKLLVIGVGGAGWAIAQQVQVLTGGQLLALNTDHEALAAIPMANQLQVSGQILAEGNLLEKFGRELDNSFADVHQLIVTVGLGGMTGTNIAPLLVKIAVTKGIDVCVAATLPFAFEGSRQAMASKGLDVLKKMGVPIFIYDNASIEQQEAATSISLLAAFKAGGKFLASNVSAYMRRN
ncbi:MAG: hypothetical protein RIR18_297 [Pseudomonadota bacterium]|jgi:cell division GTPase FtsZ